LSRAEKDVLAPEFGPQCANPGRIAAFGPMMNSHPTSSSWLKQIERWLAEIVRKRVFAGALFGVFVN
jgi:hypothetical protein